MTIYALGEHTPQLHEDTWVAPDANLIGKVVLEQGASVWFGCTIRADHEEIRVGAGSNVQENCVMHIDAGYPLTIGRNCTIGHKVMLHGCTIGNNSLIGMGATNIAARRRDTRTAENEGENCRNRQDAVVHDMAPCVPRATPHRTENCA